MRFYLSLLLRRLPWMLLIVVLVSAAGVTLARILPPVYVSRAILIVETEQIPGDLAETTVRTGAIEQLQIIQQRILTRARLLDMANKLKIYDQPGQTGRPLTGDEKITDLRRRIKIVTTGGGQATRAAQQATIVTVSFEAASPQLAATVANEVVTMLLDENVMIRTAVAGQTLEFFTAEADRLEQALSRKGAEILAFQEANLDSLPDSLEFRRSQQAAAQERLAGIERDISGLKDRRAKFVELYETTGQIALGPAPAQQLTPDQRRLQAMTDELNQALAVLSPENPRVKALQSQVDALESKIAGQAPGEAAAPALSLYDLQLADIDAQVEALQLQRSQVEATLAALQKTIEATPGNAIRLATLERDNDNLRIQYNQAVAAKAQAETGQQLESLSKSQRISVIENAIPPQEPSSPNRLLIAAGGVFGGLALAAGLFLLLELLNTRIRRPEDLTAKLGLAAFGTLPLIRTRAERLRRGLATGAAVAAVMIAIPAALWYVNTHVTPLDLLIDGVMDRLGLAGRLPGAGGLG